MLMSLHSYEILVWSWMGIAVLTFLVNLRIVAPYGRHSTTTWGPMIDNRLGWFLMETPVLIIFPLLFFLGDAEKSTPTYLFLALYCAHYAHRALIFPWRLRTKGKKMPLAIMFMAVIFNFINAGSLGYYFGFLAPVYPDAWLYSPAFLGGLVLFLAGAYINLRADTMLLNLRKPGEKGYKIPRGFLFDYISCPNHFGEIIEWLGYGLLTLSLPGFCFALWTAANLAPRALQHHRWYRERFPEYPEKRKALIPWLR